MKTIEQLYKEMIDAIAAHQAGILAYIALLPNGIASDLIKGIADLAVNAAAKEANAQNAVKTAIPAAAAVIAAPAAPAA